MLCPSCSSRLADAAAFCGRCGARVDAGAQATVSSPGEPVRERTPDAGAFTPGTLLGDRYRIVAPLGRGGMGEVYRADDLKLGQAVALKFLPAAVQTDPDRRARFVEEVRVARQIAHPNVCRVYDIGEIDRRVFLSMEYVDGEDLASLLRRIGRLPADKGLDLARQLCAGLAAAHERGVVHRDLKPANVMVDGRGRVRLTDFGLAGLAGDDRGQLGLSGTPAYMAPEQLRGGAVTPRADVYALGLVLYELLNGRPTFEVQPGGSLADLSELRGRADPASFPFVREVDPVLRQVVGRCLEPDPAKRPASAVAVAAWLPGGDPLAAAVAAGDTPSPGMVAAAGDAGPLRPATAWALLATTLALFGCASLLFDRTMLYRLAVMEQSPTLLSERARMIVRDAAYDTRGFDSVGWFSPWEEFLEDRVRRDRSAARWTDLAHAPAVLFRSRASPRALAPLNAEGMVSAEDPPMSVAGMVNVTMDADGRLLRFAAVPVPAVDSPSRVIDWTALFAAAGLAPEAFRPVEPIRLPPVGSDARAEWESNRANGDEVPTRVVAASYAGAPVYFEVERPGADLETTHQPTAGTNLGVMAVEHTELALFIVGLVGSVVLARRNLRSGSGDRAGAFTVAATVVILRLAIWMLRANHVTAPREEWGMLVRASSQALFWGGFTWMLYVALEPFARRRWPMVLVAWSRLLAGRVRDPLVGRSLLVGALAGGALAALIGLLHLVPVWIGLPPARPSQGNIAALTSARHVVAQLLENHYWALFYGLGALFLALFLRAVLRHPVVATIAWMVPVTLLSLSWGEHLVIDLVFAALQAAIILVVLTRFGLLASIAGFVVFFSLLYLPIAIDVSTWYWAVSFPTLLLLMSTAVWAFNVSLGGRPAFGRWLEE